MIRLARHLALPLAVAAVAGASTGGTLFLLGRLDATTQANVTMHTLAAAERSRFSAENKASIADRKRIADQLGRIEEALDRGGLLGPGPRPGAPR